MTSAVTWAAQLPSSSIGLLGRLRLIRGLEAARCEPTVWVRGPELDGAAREAVFRTPWSCRYEVLEDGALRPAGSRLPGGRLPDAEWTPLVRFVAVILPQAAPSGLAPARLPVSLRPATTYEESAILRAAADVWLTYVSTAPGVRLERLVFAVDETDPDRVWIRGTPLPALPGTQFVERDGVIVPAGFRWEPDVAPAVLRLALGVEAAEDAALFPESAWIRIPHSAWIAAQRSAVRLALNPAAYAR